MNDYRTYGQFDDQTLAIGDKQFLGLNMLDDPTTLPPGYVQRSESMRFEMNGARARGGTARQLTAGDTVETIQCAGVYRPDGSNDRIALVNTTRLTLFNPADQSTARYDFPAGETVAADDDSEMIQGGLGSGTTPVLYIGRGFDKDVLKFDGTSVTVDTAFKRFSTGIFAGDRMGVISSAWEINASDLLDFTTWSALAQFQILKGGDDYLVSMRPYQKDYVLISSRKKWLIGHFDPKVSGSAGTGQDGGIADSSFLRELTREAGNIGKRANNESNGKIWSVTDRAIFAFQPRLDLELTVLGTPISAPIQPIMDRMSADYANQSGIEHSGHRQFFALPISGEKVSIVTAVAVETADLELPFDLPAILGGGFIVTITTEDDHGLSPDDLVQVTGSIDTNLNVIRTVLSTPDSRTFLIDVEYASGVGAGERAFAQKIATRPNVLAVWNFALPKQSRDPDAPDGAWESIDFLPSGLFADFLVIADAPGGQRRLWIVDADLGPCLYEEGDSDEITDTAGGLELPFDLPAELSLANFGSVPVAGYVKSRTYQWGGIARHVKAGSARMNLGNDDAGTLTLTVRTPGRTEWTGSKTFEGLTETDKPVRKRCGRRGIEAELEVLTTGGRPAVRQLMLEVVNSGRDKED